MGKGKRNRRRDRRKGRCHRACIERKKHFFASNNDVLIVQQASTKFSNFRFKALHPLFLSATIEPSEFGFVSQKRPRPIRFGRAVSG